MRVEILQHRLFLTTNCCARQMSTRPVSTCRGLARTWPSWGTNRPNISVSARPDLSNRTITGIVVYNQPVNLMLHTPTCSLVYCSAASWVKKVGGAGSCNFPTDSCKFPTKRITGAQNFNFAPKFPYNREFLAPNFVFLTKFSIKKIIFQFSDRCKISGGNCAHPCCTTPLIQIVYFF